jgi:hypothetical protein
VRSGYVYFEVDAGLALVIDEDKLNETVRDLLKGQLESELEDNIKEKIEQDNITEIIEPEHDGNGWVIKYVYKVEDEDEERTLYAIDVDDEDFINEAADEIKKILVKPEAAED